MRILFWGLSLAFLLPGLTVAEAVDYSGSYKSILRLKKNGCGPRTPKKLRYVFDVAQSETGIFSTITVRKEVVPLTTTTTTKGFVLTYEYQGESKKWGACVEKHKVIFARISPQKAKRVVYNYSEKCQKNGRTSWACRTKHKGKAKRRT